MNGLWLAAVAVIVVRTAVTEFLEICGRIPLQLSLLFRRVTELAQLFMRLRKFIVPVLLHQSLELV